MNKLIGLIITSAVVLMGATNEPDMTKLSNECTGGNAESCKKVGELYYKKQDFENAIKSFTKACDKGNGASCYNLGMFYYNAKGVKQDNAKAKEFFQKACKFKFERGCQNYQSLSN